MIIRPSNIIQTTKKNKKQEWQTVGLAHPYRKPFRSKKCFYIRIIFVIQLLVFLSNSSQRTFLASAQSSSAIINNNITTDSIPDLLFHGPEDRQLRTEESPPENATRVTEKSFSSSDSRFSEKVFRSTIFGTTLADATSRLYDAIVIGGGSAGCPLARTLADAGKEVLLIERGGARKDYPETLDIYGAGIVIDNKDVSQPILTTDGVFSHIGAVLSGGSAINMAIVIEEVEEYFQYLESFPGVSFNRRLLEDSFKWTLSWLAHVVPGNLPYGQRWRLGLEKVYGPNMGYSTSLYTNSSWGGSTSFDSDNNWFRVAADVALGLPGFDFPPSLHVLLRHTVHKIDFEFDKETGMHRATCVRLARATADDTAPIGAKKATSILRFPSLLSLFTRKKSPEFSAFVPSGLKYKACVKPGGQIVSSAGALLTPLLLHKSGVGRRDFVENLRVPLVREIPELFRGLRDRVLIPIGLFFQDPMPDTGHPPRICQSIGLSKVGSDCKDFAIGDRTLACSLLTAEELSGARIAEGTIYATRYIIPPQIRNDPLVGAIFQVSSDCANGRSPLNNPLLNGLCVLSQPLTDCFRKVAANFYFTAEPKSLADVQVTKKGEFIISGNYLTDKQDLQDAMRGVANIIRVINSDVYDGIFQPAGLNSCPMKILNAMINMADNEAMRWQDISGMSADATENSLSQMKAFLHKAIEDFEDENKRKTESESVPLAGEERLDDENEKMLEGTWLNLFGSTNPHPRRYWVSQRYATYPPSIPEPTDADGLKMFAKTFMTSIWHWVGSAQMGVVVDADFKVKGFENLRIVDASVLNQVTRMNPFFTLTSLGRYAGLLVIEDALPSPPPVNP